jgi:hypothetical protein
MLDVENLKGLLTDLLTVASENLKDALDIRDKLADIFENTLPGGGLAKAIADARASIENNLFAQVGSVRDALDNIDITLEGDFAEQFADVRADLSDVRDRIQGDIATHSGILKDNIDQVRSDVAATTGSIRNRLEEVNSSLSLTLGDHSAILDNVKSNTVSILSRNDTLLNLSSQIDGNLSDLEARVGSVGQGTLSDMVADVNGRLLNILSKDRARDASDLYSVENLRDVLSGALRSIEVPSVISNLPTGVVIDEVAGTIELPEHFDGDRLTLTITPPENIGARVENWVTGVNALDTPLNIDTPVVEGLNFTVDIDLPSASEIKEVASNTLLLLAGSESDDVGGIKFTPISNNAKPWKIIRR